MATIRFPDSNTEEDFVEDEVKTGGQYPVNQRQAWQQGELTTGQFFGGLLDAIATSFDPNQTPNMSLKGTYASNFQKKVAEAYARSGGKSPDQLYKIPSYGLSAEERKMTIDEVVAKGILPKEMELKERQVGAQVTAAGAEMKRATTEESESPIRIDMYTAQTNEANRRADAIQSDLDYTKNHSGKSRQQFYLETEIAGRQKLEDSRVLNDLILVSAKSEQDKSTLGLKLYTDQFNEVVKTQLGDLTFDPEEMTAAEFYSSVLNETYGAMEGQRERIEAALGISLQTDIQKQIDMLLRIRGARPNTSTSSDTTGGVGTGTKTEKPKL